MKERLLFLSALLSAIVVPPASAAFRCFDDSQFPKATDLYLRHDTLYAVLAGSQTDEKGKGPVVRLSEDGNWVGTDQRACAEWGCEPRPKREDCSEKIPDIESDYGERGVSACFEHQGTLYFGLAAYQGEGVNEAGGVGRYVPETGQLEVRYPAALRDYSVSSLVYDGEMLWIASEYSTECGGGTIPGAPLARYDWKKDEWWPVEHHGCGFAVFDMQLTRDALWLATDLGITQISRTPDRWGRRDYQGVDKHYTAFAVGDMPKTVSCGEVYDRMLTTVFQGVGVADLYTPFDILLDAIAKQTPSYLKSKYVELTFKQPAEELSKAMQRQDKTRVAALLQRGADPWYETYDRAGPLRRAVDIGDLDALKTLVAAGDIDWSQDWAGEKSLLRMARDKPMLFTWLVDQGARADQKLLREVMQADDFELFKRLAENGDLLAFTARDSALVHALKNEKLRYAEVLLENGATGSVDNYPLEEHPLVLAVSGGYEELLEPLSKLPLTRGLLQWLLEQQQSVLVRRLAKIHAPLGRQGVDAIESAVSQGDGKTLQILFGSGAVLSAPAYNRVAVDAVRQAASSGDTGVMKLLLAHAPDLTARAKRQMLNSALNADSEAVITLLLERGFAQEVDLALRQRAVSAALRFGIEGVVEQAMAEGLASTERERTKLLEEALVAGNHQLVVTLVTKVDVNKRRHSRGPLHASLETMRKCFGNNNDRSCYRGGSLLIEAARYGRTESIRALLQAGARQDLRDPVGATPLLVAAAHGQSSAMQALVVAGARWSQTDDLNNTALHYVVLSGNREAVAFVLKHAESLINNRNIAGETPLHIAAEEGAVEAVELLLAAGADRHLPMWPKQRVSVSGARLDDLAGVPGLIIEPQVPTQRTVGTPDGMGESARGGFVGVTTSISSTSLRPDQPSGDGMTALDIARSRGHEAVVRLLEPSQNSSEPVDGE